MGMVERKGGGNEERKRHSESERGDNPPGGKVEVGIRTHEVACGTRPVVVVVVARIDAIKSFPNGTAESGF